MLSPLFTPDAEADAAFDESTNGFLLHYTPRLLAFLIGVTVLVWPLDALVFGHVPGAVATLGRLRWESVLMGVAALAVVQWVPVARRHAMVFVLGLLLLFVAHLGRILGALEALGFPLLSYAPFVFLYPAPLPVALTRRVLVTVLEGAALLGGFVLGGGRLEGPRTYGDLVFLTFCAAGAVALGHMVRSLVRRNFEQSRSLERQARELAALNGSLEERVQAQTASLRALAERLSQAVESERARVAMDLHDNLGQHLTAVRMAARVARQRLGAAAEGPLSMLEGLVTRSHEVLREIVWQLRPTALDQLGLAAAVESLAQRAEEHGPLGLTAHIDDDGSRVPEAAALACFRIAQEALTNVTRHAEATKVELTLRIVQGAAELTVQDDGRGFDTSAPAQGTGLTSMRERASVVGAALTISPASPRGTRLHLHLPAGARPA